MANINGTSYKLTEANLLAIKNEIDSNPEKYAGHSTGGIAKLLNEKPLVDNQPIEQVAAPSLTFREFLKNSQLDITDLVNIKNDPAGAIAYELLKEFNRVDLNDDMDIIFIGVIKGLVSTEKATLISSLATIDDPLYKSKVPGSSIGEVILSSSGIVLEGLDIVAAQSKSS